MLYENLSINQQGHLTFAGIDTVSAAEEYGTPLYLIDENGLRKRCKMYKTAFDRLFPNGSLPIFAGKSLCFKKIYNIIDEERLGADVSSIGEVYTAVKAGFPAEKIFFHGNNKTESDISLAMDMGIKFFICDNLWELESINTHASARNIRQNVILRITPGIDPHTFDAVNTGRVDSKFGVPIETGQAKSFVAKALSLSSIKLSGYHCHIGSQIFDGSAFIGAADIMVNFIYEMKTAYDYIPEYLDLGGGMGVAYTSEDPKIDYISEMEKIAGALKTSCSKYGLDIPKIIMEPGRSLVADNGITLYTVGGIKEIPEFKNYVAIDGGMTDNPRYALYKSKYTALLASRANDTADYLCTIAGRCCESGDLIGENMMLPKPRRGEILAVLTTGAYNYSMASNYNRIPRPPVIMVKDGKTYIAVKRETLDDLLKNDM